ncbi:hypothetical protein Tco_0090592 [Tanacetum coccineum]
MEAHLAPMQPTQVKKVTTSCEICSGPYDTQYCLEDPEQAFVEYASSRNNEIGNRQFTTNLGPRSFKEATNTWKDKPNFNWERTQCFTSPQKGSFSTYSSRSCDTDEMEDKVESEEEVKEETEEEAKEEEEGNPEHFDTFPTINELRYHEWLLKNPRPPWVKAKIRTGDVNNVKFSCMIGQFNKEQAYLDLESPVNIMSRLHYNWIISNRLEPRRKLLNLKKNCNFIGRVRGLKVFVGNFTYECDFMVLEDTTSVIDHYLGSVVFGKPFMEETGLVYNKKEGTVVFKRVMERILFKMPHKMDMFKHIDFADRGTDNIHPFVIESDDDNCEKTHYSDSLDLGPEYKYDELYLMRRCLEVLRKFHGTILEGRFNQLSHVSSPLLSKPGEY